ncbi:unnamed protein product [Enterobius vermicularis]|uniref:Uncharacterized protein n=1 Tax=Enterobius vermicularis TaxID=51028 RepID=A0A0N4V064_ENTVE|nr:unnamed protein product [Enterobius vermicularis]
MEVTPFRLALVHQTSNTKYLLCALWSNYMVSSVEIGNQVNLSEQLFDHSTESQCRYFCCPTSRNGIKEWTIVELQGVLEIGQDFLGKLIGNLAWMDKTAYLIITHNILEGKEAKLEKPLIVLSLDSNGNKNQLVTAIIKKKIIFRTRPKPLLFREFEA